MKNKLIQFSILTMVVLAHETANAYELATHARLTYKAYAGSSLYPTQNNTLLQNLGIDLNVGSNPSVPFGTIYYDVSGSTVKERSVDTFEKGFMTENPNNMSPVIPPTAGPNSLPGWLMRGAIREDDNNTKYAHGDPDLPKVFHREFNHFFDPVNNRPLTVFGAGTYYFFHGANTSALRKAPDWAAGTNDVFSNANQRGSDTLNHFTVLDAREAEYRALTLKAKNPDGSYTDINPSGSLTTKEAVRKAYWATTFRALGDILHLNQDMAQPQHTRNEPHSGAGPNWVQDNFSGHESVYELYMDARAKGDAEFKLDGNLKAITSGGLPYTGYPIPSFAKYSDYWSTGPGAGSVTGSGLADYSNAHFFTLAHNIDDPTYSFPSTNPGAYSPQSLPCDYSTGSVNFNYLTANSIKMTTSSVLTNVANSGASYSLNKCNYDDMASLLIPRAVAYSAGLLNYFFRGRMQISLPDDGVYGIADHAVNNLADGQGGQGFYKIKVKLQNTTPPSASQAQDMAGGKLVAVAKYHRDACYAPDLAGEVNAGLACRDPEEKIVTSTAVLDANGQPVTSVTLHPNDPPQTFTFVFNTPIPINMTDFYLQVVYRGPLGTENDAVAVATQDAAEPTFWAHHDSTDYLFCLNGAWHYKAPDGTITPADQTAITQAGYRLSDLSTRPLGETRVALQPQDLATPLVVVSSLQPGQYFRVAVLTERNRTYMFQTSSYQVRGPQWTAGG